MPRQDRHTAQHEAHGAEMTSDAMPMRERDLQDAIVQAARLLEWQVYFVWRSVHSPTGWVDLFLLKGGQARAYECKTATGRVRPMQQDCIDALNAAGIPARIVRPADLDDVLRELQEAA